MSNLSSHDQAEIRWLLDLYRRGRDLSYTRLAQELGDHGVPSDRGHLHRLQNPKRDFPGLSPELALALHAVLGFGQFRDPSRDGFVQPDHYHRWFAATHLHELRETLVQDELDVEAETLFRWLLLQQPIPKAQWDISWAWGRARVRALRFKHKLALPLLHRAVADAERSGAPHQLLGIMQHDLSGAYLCTGDFARAKDHTCLTEREYGHLGKSGLGDRPNVKVGQSRAAIRYLSYAAWEGQSLAECNEIFEHALTFIRSGDGFDLDPAHDHYGWCEALHCLGYVHLFEGRYEEASRLANLALDHAREAHRNPFKRDQYDVYIALRDGSFFSTGWLLLHARSLQADAQAHLADPRQLRAPRTPLGTLILQLTLDLFTRSWAKQLPPLYPMYSWKWEYASRTKSPEQLDAEILRRAYTTEQLGFVIYLPQMWISRGDFLLEVRHDQPAAIEAYETAAEKAKKYKFGRYVQVAHKRINAVL